VHLHALIKFQHHTWLRLNCRAIKQFFLERLTAIDDRIRNIYCSVKWVRVAA